MDCSDTAGFFPTCMIQKASVKSTFSISPWSQHLVRLTMIQTLQSSLPWHVKKRERRKEHYAPKNRGLITAPALPSPAHLHPVRSTVRGRKWGSRTPCPSPFCAAPWASPDPLQPQMFSDCKHCGNCLNKTNQTPKLFLWSHNPPSAITSIWGAFHTTSLWRSGLSLRSPLLSLVFSSWDFHTYFHIRGTPTHP